jgi:hypothetical protein
MAKCSRTEHYARTLEPAARCVPWQASSSLARLCRPVHKLVSVVMQPESSLEPSNVALALWGELTILVDAI